MDGSDLSLVLGSPDTDTPRIVRALVDEGADVRAVYDEEPALEDVYLKLLAREASRA